MTDAWHPNWTVTVDGVARHLGRVDEAFRGVVLEPGAHTIEMRYRPRTLVAGQAVSLATLLALSVLLLLRRRIDPRLAHVPPA